jgi:hypothetical protein
MAFPPFLRESETLGAAPERTAPSTLARRLVRIMTARVAEDDHFQNKPLGPWPHVGANHGNRGKTTCRLFPPEGGAGTPFPFRPFADA